MNEREIWSPRHGAFRPISYTLSSMASQEGCDGEPWDQLQQASDYIRELGAYIETLEQARKEANNLYSILSERLDADDPIQEDMERLKKAMGEEGSQ